MFETQIQARMRDINLAGHVDNVEAIRIIDEARLLFLRADDPVTGHRAVLHALPDGVGELVGAQRVDYHSEMRFVAFQPFLVRMWITHIGRSSFTVDYDLRIAADHPAAIIGETSCVFWDLDTQAAWQISEEMRATLESHRGEPIDLRARPGA